MRPARVVLSAVIVAVALPAAAPAGDDPAYDTLPVSTPGATRGATFITGCLPDTGCVDFLEDPELGPALRVKPAALLRLSIAPRRSAEVAVERRSDGRLAGRRTLGGGTGPASYRLPRGVRSGDVLRVFVRYRPHGNALFELTLSVAR